LDRNGGGKSSDSVDGRAEDVEDGVNNVGRVGDAVDVQHILSHKHQIPLYLLTLVSENSS